MSFGPPRDRRHTFQRLDDNPRWSGIWDLDEAGRYAIMSYFRAYGPATEEHIRYWLGNGLSAGRKRLTSWFAVVRDRLTAVDIEGEPAYLLTEDVEELSATPPSDAVRFLPGHDQWVIGPGTKDQHVVRPDRRTPVTRKANLVVAGGIVSGTWSTTADEIAVKWFAEQGDPPRKAIEEQAATLADILGRPLSAGIDIA